MRRMILALVLSIFTLPFLIGVDLLNSSWDGRELGQGLVTLALTLWLLFILRLSRSKLRGRGLAVALTFASVLSLAVTIGSYAFQDKLGRERYQRALFKASYSSGLVTYPRWAQRFWGKALRLLPARQRYLIHLAEDAAFVQRLRRELRSKKLRRQVCGSLEVVACFDDIVQKASTEYLITQAGVIGLMTLRAGLIHDERGDSAFEQLKAGLKHFETWGFFRTMRAQQSEHWQREFPDLAESHSKSSW